MLINEVLLRAVGKELNKALHGSRVDKIFQPLPDLLVLELFPTPDKTKLALSCNRTYGFLGLVHERPPNPPEPPVFCGLLRKHLKGGRLQQVSVAHNDRLVKLQFSKKLGENIIEFVLELRLWGDKPNLLLFSGQGNHLGKMVNYSHHHGPLPEDPDYEGREVGTSTYPSLDELKELLQRESARQIMSTVPGLSPMLIEIAQTHEEGPAWLLDIIKGEAPIEPTNLTWPLSGRTLLLPHSPPFELNDNIRQQRAPALFSAIEEQFYKRGLTSRRDNNRRELEKIVNRGRKKLTRKMLKLKEGLAATDKVEAITHKGEVLKTVLGKIKPRDKKVEAFDWLAGKTIEITLDSKLTPQENLARIFARAKKQKRSLPILQQQVQDTEEELVILKMLDERLSSAELDREFDEVRQALSSMGLIREQGQRKKRRRKKGHEKILRSYTSSDGYKIYVGRNAVENEYLTARVAKKHDLWFHARDLAGAHVVVKLSRGQTCPKATAQEAAQLAVHFSKGRYDTRVEVCRTRGSEVRRPAKAPPGTVNLRQYDVVVVRPDSSVIRKLIGHEALASCTKDSPAKKS